MSMSLNDAGVFTNLNGLHSINQLGKTDSDAALRKVAEQFEAIFLNIMLKGMRASEDALFSDNYLNSNEMKFHRENMDNQLALHMASTGGVGLADVLYRQLSANYSQSSEASRQNIATGAEMQTMPDGRRIRERPDSNTTRFDTPQDFVEALLPVAQKYAGELGVDARALVAQAALETGWGQKMIRGADGRESFNLFGVKASGSWSGQAVSVSTLEYRDGVMEREQATFRAYDSFEESFRDYVRLLSDNPRYQGALANAGNTGAFVHELQQAGYATDPQYAEKITRVLASPAFDSVSDSTSAQRVLR